MAKRKERTTYSEEDRIKLIDEWKKSGLSPYQFAKTAKLTGSMFNRWLIMRGHVAEPKGQMAGGKPKSLTGEPPEPKTSNRHSDNVIRKALHAVYGPGGKSVSGIAKKMGLNKGVIYAWRNKRPDLMPKKGTQLALPNEGATMIPKEPAPRAPAEGLEDLQLSPAFAQVVEKKEAAWTELLGHLQGLPQPRTRLRVLSLIETVAS